MMIDPVVVTSRRRPQWLRKPCGLLAMAMLILSPGAGAAVLVNETFAHPDGNLVGRAPTPGPGGVWAAHSGAGSLPVQVSSGAILLQQGSGSREDVNTGLGRTQGTGETLYAGFDLTVTGGAGVSNTYFAHFRDSGTTFTSRLFVTAPQSGGSFRLGLSPTGTSPAVTWPTDLNYGVTYRVVHAFERGSGASRLWIDPVDAASASVAATTASAAAIQSYAFRQADGNTAQRIDNLRVADSFAEALAGGSAPTPPTLTSSIPAAGAADVDPAIGQILLVFSEALAATTDPTGWTVRCPAGSGANLIDAPVQLDLAAGTATLPVATLPPGQTCRVTLPAGSLVGATSGLPTTTDLTREFSIAAPLAGCGDRTETRIWAIQGTGTASPLVGQSRTIEGVVVGAFQGTDGSGLSGFFVQEEDADADADVSTSDGIFVFDSGRRAPSLVPGDVVRVTGTVAEFRRSSDSTGNTLTQLTDVTDVTVCGSGSATPAPVQLPLASDPTTALEPAEGMAVVLTAAAGDLTLAEYFNLDRYGEIRVASGGRPQQFTMANPPDRTGYSAHVADLARRTLMIDDGRSGQNLDPLGFGRGGWPLDVQRQPPNLLRGGDTVAEIRGVMHYDVGVYRLQPTAAPNFVAGNERPEQPPAVAGRVRVASFNVLNYFQQFDDGTAKCGPPGWQQTCRGADAGLRDSQGRSERDRQEQKLIPALLRLDADVYGLIELENDFGAGGETSAQRLARLMNDHNAAHQLTDCSDYVAVHPGDWVGTDVIAVGLIYCANTVGIAPGSVPAVLEDAGLADLGLGHLAPLFTGAATNRAPLAVSFRELASGEGFTIAVNHFKSKGGSGLETEPVCLTNPGFNPNCDQGDGAGFWNQRRVDAATALVAWLASGPTGSHDPDWLIVGDLNSYGKEAPIARLETAGFENLGARIGGYSYLFDAQLGTLDYALASPLLQPQVQGIAHWHINADEPDALDYDISFNPEHWYWEDPFRTSDHDPLLVGLALVPRPGDLTGDGLVDGADQAVLRGALGSRAGQPRFVGAADYDGDRVISFRDYQIWYGHWRRAAGG